MQNQATSLYALSIKQPWAALIVGGVKTIEIRRWPTARRGKILIHAARVPEKRDEVWRHVPGTLGELAQLQGGIIGSVELTECKRYDDLSSFMTDQQLHLNEAEWFEPPVLYGFKFAEPQIVPYHRFPGWFRFFQVEWPAPSGVDGEPAGLTRRDQPGGSRKKRVQNSS